MKLKELAERIEGELIGSGEVDIRGVNLPDQAGPHEIIFLGKPALLQAAGSSRAGAFLVGLDCPFSDRRPKIASAAPRHAFIQLLHIFEPQPSRPPGLHPSVAVGEGCTIHPTARLLAGCVLGDQVVIEQDVVVHPLCSLGDRVNVGAGSQLFSQVVVGPGCRIGCDCRLSAGVVIGSDGFGYQDESEQRIRVPHLGRVILGDRVEIGANSTIDRAVLGDTVIGDDTKIDNLVHVGHNCTIGRMCYLVAQSGIGGSTRIEDGVSIAGQSGISDHLKIGRGAVVIGKSAVRQSVPAGEIVGGIPARPIREENRIIEALAKLPELVQAFENEPIPGNGRAPFDRPDRSHWRREVLHTLARNLRVPPDTVGEDLDLKEHFDADSLTVLSVVTEIEARFEITIPDQDVRRLTTLKEILNYLEQRL